MDVLVLAPNKQAAHDKFCQWLDEVPESAKGTLMCETPLAACGGTSREGAVQATAWFSVLMHATHAKDIQQAADARRRRRRPGVEWSR